VCKQPHYFLTTQHTFEKMLDLDEPSSDILPNDNSLTDLEEEAVNNTCTECGTWIGSDSEIYCEDCEDGFNRLENERSR